MPKRILIDAEVALESIAFVKGALYECEECIDDDGSNDGVDLSDFRFYTPNQTLDGWACDCWVFNSQLEPHPFYGNRAFAVVKSDHRVKFHSWLPANFDPANPKGEPK